MKILKIILLLAAICYSAYSQENGITVLPLALKNSPGIKSNFEITNFRLAEDSTIKNKPKNQKTEKQYKIIPWRIITLGALGVTVFTAMHLYYRQTWWKEQRKYFKFAEDGYYARNMDKASHIFTANAFTVTLGEAYKWTGISPKNALLYGALTAMAYETYIEINDGFAPIWGFDWMDMASNIVGAVYPFLQIQFPVLKNFNIKWSFKPEWINKKIKKSDDLLDDYTDMTFWLSVTPEGLLPKSIAKYYPGFIAFALGLSIKNASHVTGSTHAYREWFLSLDYDITKLPGNTGFLKSLKKILNFYHFPAPAVRFSPSGVWYGLYF